MLKVEGTPEKDIFSGQQDDTPYHSNLIPENAVTKSETSKVINLKDKLMAKGKIKVNAKYFNGQMPAHDFLSNENIAAVLTYEQNSWGNKGEIITPGEVKLQRSNKK